MRYQTARTYMTDDCAIEVVVLFDKSRNRYAMNSKSPRHNYAQQPTTFPSYYDAIEAARQEYARLTGKEPE